MNETTWDLEPHTKAKHMILDRYLKAWFPIMASFKKRIIYIDGFAGPGIYRGGENGSPIIALNIVKDHVIDINSEVIMIFIEQDERRCLKLQNEIDKIELPDNVKYKIYCDTFESKITEILDYLDQQEKRLAPSFVFIDPFGYSQTPFCIIERIMQYPGCEFMITFMYDFINRFIGESEKEKTFNELFGTNQWTDIDKEENPEGRKRFIHDLYLKQLRSRGRVKYFKSFEMINKHNHTEYFLFYGTKHLKGLEKMKEAMWVVDSVGGYSFSDNTDPLQTVLFEKEPNYSQLKRLIMNKFKGRPVRIEELEKFVIEQTPFLKKHLRKPILIPMEKADPPEITVSNRKRKGTYPKGCKITFL